MKLKRTNSSRINFSAMMLHENPLATSKAIKGTHTRT